MRRPAAPTEADLSGPAYLVASRILGEEVWLVEDEAHAAELDRELAAEKDRRLVFTLTEVFAMQGMLEADMRTLARIKRLFPGARLDRVTFPVATDVVQ